MGTSTSWVAVEGASLEQVAQALGLAPAPDGAAADEQYQAVALEAGWLLLVHRMKHDGVVADSDMLRKLSSRWRVVGCDEESHVMYSAVAEWREGREVWAVIHASERSPADLDARGDLPAGWTVTRDEYVTKQVESDRAAEGVDYVYEVPLVVAEAIVGYRLDEEDEHEYVALVEATHPPPAASRSKPWWKLW